MKLRIVSMTIGLVFLLAMTAANAQDEANAIEVTLNATGFAESAGLGDVTGEAFVYVEDGVILKDGVILIQLHPNGATIPEGTVLEGWLVDLGIFNEPSASNVSVADQTYGPPFGNLALDVLVSSAPYALSTGLVSEDESGNWSLEFRIPNYNFSPYDAVVITAESDGNQGEWDPRPGTPFFAGGIAEGTEALAIERLGMVGPIAVPEAREPIQVELGPTPLAAGAGLGQSSGSATLYSTPRYGYDTARIDFTIHLNGSAGPGGCLVLEGWVVDAGLLGGPGVSNSYDGDEAWGLPFHEWDARFDAAVEAAPYALSTGVAADNGDGTLSASIHFPGYNFAPYDAFVVTLESDCNDSGFDPRPGTPVLIGMIGDRSE